MCMSVHNQCDFWLVFCDNFCLVIWTMTFIYVTPLHEEYNNGYGYIENGLNGLNGVNGHAG